AGIELGELLVARPPKELRLRIGGAERGVLGPAADDPDRGARALGGLQRHVHALVPDQLGDDEQPLPRLDRGEAVRLHGRVDYDRVAAVVALDALAAELGDRDVLVDSPARGEVPPANASQLRPQQGTQRWRDLGDGALLLIPRIAEGRVAVTHVYGPRGSVNAVGERAAAAQHDPRGRELQPLDGQRIEG